MFRQVIEYLDGANGITLSAHCHDDLGLGVANTLAAVQAGVRPLELTLNGIGERAGKPPLEKVLGPRNVRQTTPGQATHVDLDRFYCAARPHTENTSAPV